MLEETIQRAEEHAVAAVEPGFVHPSQIETDEGAEDEIPAWRKKELEQKEQEVEEFIQEQESSRSPKHGIRRQKDKRRSSKELKQKGEDLVAKLEALPDELEPEQHIASVLVDYDNGDYLAKRQSALAAAEAAAEEEDPCAVPTLARSDSIGSYKAPKIPSRVAAEPEQPTYENVAAAEPAPEQPVYENTVAATKPVEASKPEQPVYENTTSSTMPQRGSIRLPKLNRDDFEHKPAVGTDGRYLSESEKQSASVDTEASAARLDNVVFDFNFG